jgi:hypothetical protein
MIELPGGSVAVELELAVGFMVKNGSDVLNLQEWRYGRAASYLTYIGPGIYMMGNRRD